MEAECYQHPWLVDVMPTLADLAGLSMPADEPLPLDGTSLVPLIQAAAAGDSGAVLRDVGCGQPPSPRARQDDRRVHL